MLPYWLIPKWAADAVGDRLVSFLVMTEDLPEERNRVQLNADGSIRLDYWPNNLVAHKRLLKRFHEAMHKAGRMCYCLEGHRAQIDGILPLYGTAHQCGTLRMGDDPQTSVVGADCKAHDVDNIYVVDTSVFVTSTAVNPALTAIANSLRVADIIAERHF
jgi:choline dehydrogenase-like flavoprotein